MAAAAKRRNQRGAAAGRKRRRSIVCETINNIGRRGMKSGEISGGERRQAWRHGGNDSAKSIIAARAAYVALAANAAILIVAYVVNRIRISNRRVAGGIGVS